MSFEINLEEDVFDLPVEHQIDFLVWAAKADVEKAISESGKSKVVWLATSSDAPEMLCEWKQLQDGIKEEYGIEVPDLIDGVTINECEGDLNE